MPTMDEVVPVYVDPGDFAQTKQILINTKGNTWKVPRMASTASKGLAMRLHIENNETDVTEEAPLVKMDANESIATPYHCKQLARAAEFLYHRVPEGVFMTCLPKHTKSCLGRLNDKTMYARSLEAHIRRSSEAVIRRATNVTKMLVLQEIDKPAFQQAIPSGHHDGVRIFKRLITPDMTNFVFSDHWKCIDFHFIHHEAPRSDAAEERTRLGLRRIVFYGLALLMHDIYRYLIQTKAGVEVPGDVRGRREIIRANYKLYTHYGPNSKVVRNFKDLPAASTSNK
ncbi:hypothetical protein V490_03819 [Pseudogymnoascus sp. VKM F-3557]|nr:hypothetical protein V490_03819 [Pseudogymnoascus sp. VKM F-3557]